MERSPRVAKSDLEPSIWLNKATMTFVGGPEKKQATTKVSLALYGEAGLYGEEDVVEDVVEGVEERGDKPAAEEEEDEESEHAHAVVELGGLVRQEVAEDVAAVEWGQRN